MPAIDPAPSGHGGRLRSRRLVALAAWLLSLAAAALGGWWAAQATMAPPADVLDEAPAVTYTVEHGSIGRSLPFSAVAEWSLEPLAGNWASGAVTAVELAAGDTVGPGHVLYRVDLRPVVVGQGAIPAFRDLARGDEGPDVEQLQSLLVAGGFHSGAPDGVFGRGTEQAVKRWQDALGVPDDGIVRRGDVVWVPALPARLALTEAIRVGAEVAGGEEAVLALSDAPSVWIPLAVEQRELVPLTAPVRVVHPDGEWEGRIARAEEGDTGGLNLFLEGAAGGAICGDDCADALPLRSRTDFRAYILVIPSTEGPVVPVSALSTDPGGASSISLADGSKVPVDVLASSDGLAVVDGVDVGTQILVFGE